MTHQPRQPQRFRCAPAEANVNPHNREDCGSRRGNVLLARGLNRFDNWFEKDMDDFASEQLGLGRFRNLNGYSRDASRGGRHGRQAARGDRSESLGPVQVRVWAKDEDCDEKRSATRSYNGSAFSIYSRPQSPRREGSKQIHTSSPYSGYFPRASKRDGSRMPSIPKRFSQSRETSLARK
jgi:hypothetical protein